MTTHNRHADHCDHDVTVCNHCDVAYCTKCKKEWGAPCNLAHYSYYPTVYPTWTVTSTPNLPTTTVSSETTWLPEPGICVHN